MSGGAVLSFLLRQVARGTFNIRRVTFRKRCLKEIEKKIKRAKGNCRMKGNAIICVIVVCCGSWRSVSSKRTRMASYTQCLVRPLRSQMKMLINRGLSHLLPPGLMGLNRGSLRASFVNVERIPFSQEGTSARSRCHRAGQHINRSQPL